MSRFVPTSDHEAVVVSNEQVAEATWDLVLRAPELAAALAPGRFLNLAVPGDASHVLRLPFAYARADACAGTVEVVYTVVGEGTERLSRVPAGTPTRCTGPLGRGWRLDEVGGRCLLAAGGAGLAPVVSAAEALCAAGVACDVVLAAKTAARVVEREVEALGRLVAPAGGRVVVSTDDGTRGVAGFASAACEPLLRERAYEWVLTCGPLPMMRGVAALAEEAGVRCQVSMEAMMGCGFGACNCCVIELADGSRVTCCKHGPVFEAGEVAW